MNEAESLISAACPLYACRECRTKTGWPHQSWCSLSAQTQPDCRACRYSDKDGARCTHPINRKAVTLR